MRKIRTNNFHRDCNQGNVCYVKLKTPMRIFYKIGFTSLTTMDFNNNKNSKQEIMDIFSRVCNAGKKENYGNK